MVPQFCRCKKALHFCKKGHVLITNPTQCFGRTKVLRHTTWVLLTFSFTWKEQKQSDDEGPSSRQTSLGPLDASRAKTLIINAATTLTPKCSSFDAHRWHTKSNPSLIIIVHGQANSIRPLSLSLKTTDEREVAPRQFQQADHLIISGTLATCVCALSRVGMCLFQLLSSAADVALIKLN